MSKYNEIMENVRLTEAMKERIAGSVAENFSEAKKQAAGKQLRIFLSTLTTLAAAAILMVWIYPKKTMPVEPDPGLNVGGDIGDDQGTGIGGFVYYVFRNLDEMNAHYHYEIEEFVGLPFSIRAKLYVGYGRYPQILYYGEKRDDLIYYRTYLEPGDYSGFGDLYELDTTIEVNGTTVGIRGNEGRIQTVYWPDEDNFFWHSLHYSKGFDEEEVRSMIEMNRKRVEEE